MRGKELGHPLVSRGLNAREVQPRLGVRSTGGCGEMWSPETGPRVGTPARFRKLRKLATSGKGGGYRGQEKDKKNTAPFYAMGPAPGAQRGRTAVTQVV